MKDGLSFKAKQIDLKIFYSATGNVEPNEHLHQKVFVNPTKNIVLLPPPDCAIYNTNWIYLSFFSQSGCQISVTPIFEQAKTNVYKFIRKQSIEIEDALDELDKQVR